YRTHRAGLPRPFAAVTAEVKITLGPLANHDKLDASGTFTLGAANDGIAPPTEPVTLAIGDLVTQLPAGSFHVDELGRFMYEADRLAAVLTPAGPDTVASAGKPRTA